MISPYFTPQHSVNHKCNELECLFYFASATARQQILRKKYISFSTKNKMKCAMEAVNVIYMLNDYDSASSSILRSVFFFFFFFSLLYWIYIRLCIMVLRFKFIFIQFWCASSRFSWNKKNVKIIKRRFVTTDCYQCCSLPHTLCDALCV